MDDDALIESAAGRTAQEERELRWAIEEVLNFFRRDLDGSANLDVATRQATGDLVVIMDQQTTRAVSVIKRLMAKKASPTPPDPLRIIGIGEQHHGEPELYESYGVASDSDPAGYFRKVFTSGKAAREWIDAQEAKKP